MEPVERAAARINEIDLLRFIAAISVVFFHYAFRGYAADERTIMAYPLLAPVAKYGYLGVQLFFLISGFVILMTVSRGSLKAFAVSRFVRLYPAFWACCTLTFVAIVLIGGGQYSATLPQYLANLTMLSGFVGIGSIDGVYWSLFVELQFYAMVAALLAIGRIHQAQLFLALWLLATVALEFFPVGRLRALLLTDYAVYFIGGALAFLIWSRGASGGRLALLLSCHLVALHQALSGLPQFEQNFQTSMSPYVVGGIITAFFAVMLLVALRCTGPLAARRWRLAGALTYPLYLLHQNIGFMLFNLAYPTLNRHIVLWGTLGLMLALSYAVHVFIERRYSPALKRMAEWAWDQSVQRLGPRRAVVAVKSPTGDLLGERSVD